VVEDAAQAGTPDRSAEKRQDPIGGSLQCKGRRRDFPKHGCDIVEKTTSALRR